MAKNKNFEIEKLFEKARAQPEYWVERAILDFTEDVVAKMETQQITRSEMSRKIGKSQAYVTKILRGSTNITLESMVKIALALECEIVIRLQPKGSN